MTQWRKSSHSGTSNNSDCVELAVFAEGVGVRDSKAPDAGHIVVARRGIGSLIDAIKAGRLGP
ncbi:DUF397 domain-containing protein [Spirillospora sp. NPDC029432]|uniref:DUF397 domain-containing protein n=1 Tax=Spirillospora sp. NPDC029432 TaxID=3154599 RepID=UPI003451D265